MKPAVLQLLLIGWLLPISSWAQSPRQPASGQPTAPKGQFLTDSIEIGRPFRYALTYYHPSEVDVLFPDTARHFTPYRVQAVAVFATQSTGAGSTAISRDSAVYTLISFETDSVQLLRVPIRLLNDADCTALWTQTDTVFLRSRLPIALSDSTKPPARTLVTETNLAPLQQQFNYAILATGVLAISILLAALYGLFGKTVRRLWRLFQLNRRHNLFLRNYYQLIQRINAFTAAETANQAVVMWKTYLEQLERQPYTSLTTPELAERMNDKRVTDALREADRMIYGGTFSAQSQPALRVLSDIANQSYERCRAKWQRSVSKSGQPLQQTDSAEPSTFP